jgi:hypothetical protein
MFWEVHCSYKTLKQRMAIIKWIFHHKNYEDLERYYEAVSSDAHMRANRLFRNPYKLYDPDLFSHFHLMTHGSRKLSILKDDDEDIVCPYTPRT